MIRPWPHNRYSSFRCDAAQFPATASGICTMFRSRNLRSDLRWLFYGYVSREILVWGVGGVMNTWINSSHSVRMRKNRNNQCVLCNTFGFGTGHNTTDWAIVKSTSQLMSKKITYWMLINQFIATDLWLNAWGSTIIIIVYAFVVYNLWQHIIFHQGTHQNWPNATKNNSIHRNKWRKMKTVGKRCASRRFLPRRPHNLQS